MQIKHLETIQSPTRKMNRVAAMCWTSNNRRLAIADSDGMVTLLDETGKRRDRFATKSASGKRGGHQYIIKEMAFSPDDVRLAVAQSDNIVFVYRLGLEWGDKKSICNKFQQSSPVTCMCWPHLHPYEIVFGLADGRVRVGNLRNNKSATLYATDSPVVSLAASPDGHGFVSGHVDGSIYRFYFVEIKSEIMTTTVPEDVLKTMIPGHKKITVHDCVPTCLEWGKSIIAAGPDLRVVTYKSDGLVEQNFDFSTRSGAGTGASANESQREFTSAAINPSGQCIVVGSFNRIIVLNFNMERGLWEEEAQYDINHLYNPLRMSWKPDGSQLVVGNSCGSVDMFDTCLRRMRHKREFEFTFVSPSQVIVKRLSTGHRTILKSTMGHEIQKINVAKNQFLVAHTPNTLLVGSLESFSLSEVVWQSGSGGGGDGERFFFDNPNVCLVHNAGEMAVIEYGINDIIGSFRTDHVSPHLISVRVSYTAHDRNSNSLDRSLSGRQKGNSINTLMDLEGNKKVAYLMDSHTIRILDLVSSTLVSNIRHNSRIDWLELNTKASKLLFRDKRHRLNLFDIQTQRRTTLLTYCTYVQWVPESDVVVAQNRNDLCVWYDIDSPDRVTIVPIKGEVHDIVRAQGVTTVHVDEGTGTIVPYELDEGLIEFGTALEDQDYDRAADILEDLTLTPETEAMWKNLSKLALQHNKLLIAERCYAALGDVARARYLRKVHKELCSIEDEEGGGDGAQSGIDHWRIRARMAILRGDFKTAEQIYLEQGRVQDAMDMYEKVHRFEESINLAIAHGVPDAQKKKEKYIEWLINTKQEEKAAKIHEQDGKVVEAINLYLRGGFPASAANVVIRHGISGGYHEGLLDTIAEKLKEGGLWAKAGEFYEQRSQSDKNANADQRRSLLQMAVDCYLKGNAYRNAVELCRTSFPERVVRIEEKWGDYLVQQKQTESSIHHYIEANQYKKAIEASISSRQWSKAEQILAGLDQDAAKQYCFRIGMHYEEIQDFDKAKNLYIRAGMPQEALRMFEENNRWDDVQAIAESFMDPAEISKLYMSEAVKLSNTGRFKDAEMLYIKAGEVDHAINMYKIHHMFDDMIRLVAQFRSVHLGKAHLQIAHKLQSEGQLRQAEYHFVQGGDWKSAVAMYRMNDKWNEAIQVAKAHGPASAWKKVAKEWAAAVGGEDGGEAGAKLLVKLNLTEDAIDYCLEREMWPMAFDLARTHLRSKLPDVHLKYAILLEDRRRFKEAEDEYVNAQAPKEAIEMYIHEGMWIDALRVAESYVPDMIRYVHESQAEVAFEEGEYERAEQLYVQAKKVERLIEKYKEIQWFEDAKRVADKYLGSDAQRMVTQQWAQQQLSQQSQSLDAFDESGSVMSGSNATRSPKRASSNDPAAAARMFLDAGEYSKAIDAYLQCQVGQYAPEFVERQWIHAVEVAMDSLQVRLGEVCQEVVKRFQQARKLNQAGRVLVMTGQVQDAVELFVKNRMWDEARTVARQNRPELLQYIDQRYKSHRDSSASQHSAGGADGGNTVSQLEALASRQQWEECLQLGFENRDELARLRKIDLLERYVAEYVTGLLRSRQPLQHRRALEVLVQYETMPTQDVNMYLAYREISKRIVWKIGVTESEFQEMIELAWRMLTHVLDNMEHGTSFNAKQRADLERLCELVHYLRITHRLRGNEKLSAQYTRACISLARYCDIAPADMLFYMAGQAARQIFDRGSSSAMGRDTDYDEGSWEDMTFLFLNRFVDLSHEIEESQDGEQANEVVMNNMEIIVSNGVIELDNTGFSMSDIPDRVPLPRVCHVAEEVREEILDYVTVLSVNKSDHELQTVQCENCSQNMYAAGLQCGHCGHDYPPCVITGYPVMARDRVECTSCRKPANRRDWNQVHMNSDDPRCPYCDELSILME